MHLSMKKSEIPANLLKYFRKKPAVYKSGDLVNTPNLVALALQADGWILRQDVIWHKPCPMPESVRNRCTKAHEYVFLLTKSMRYYCDMEAVKEKGLSERRILREREKGMVGDVNAKYGRDSPMSHRGTVNTQQGARKVGRNKRSVWSVDDHLALLQWLQENHTDAAEQFLKERGYKRDVWRIPPRGYKGAHYATFPVKLVEPCVKMGTSEGGCCPECGTPWRRVTEETTLKRERPNDYVKRKGEKGTGNSCANSVAGVDSKTLGWLPYCRCLIGDNDSPVDSPVDSPLDEGLTAPCTVLDPFVGSGTVVSVAISLGRRGTGIDLSERYLQDNAVPRIEGELLSRPATSRLLPRTVSPLFTEDGEWID